jgi:hypothetical protein
MAITYSSLSIDSCYIQISVLGSNLRHKSNINDRTWPGLMEFLASYIILAPAEKPEVIK